MLKQILVLKPVNYDFPAAFGRLRVETDKAKLPRLAGQPAAFGRLRVETSDFKAFDACRFVPAAFGRLRVETLNACDVLSVREASRLRAAAC